MGHLWLFIDTGCDRTCLHPRDIDELGLDYVALEDRPLSYSGGVGGLTGYYQEPALLLFRDDSGQDRICQLTVGLHQKTNDPEAREIPYLLGRDFLNLCDLRLNPAQDLVRLDPLNVAGEFVAPANPV